MNFVVTVQSDLDRPWSVIVRTEDGVEHRFMRTDDAAAANSLQAAHDGYARGFEAGRREARKGK